MRCLLGPVGGRVGSRDDRGRDDRAGGRAVRVHLRDDGLLQLPAEAVKVAAIAFLRIWLGCMWLVEVTVGHNWKLGGLASGPNPAWMGPRAGEAVRTEATQAIVDGTYPLAAWAFRSFLLPGAEVVGYLVIALQLVLGIAFVVGVFVRPLALVAIGLDLGIAMLGSSRIPPFFTAMHLFVLVTGAGRYYGLDGWILRRTLDTRRAAVRAVRWLIDLPVFRREYLAGAITVSSLVALFFFLTIPSRSSQRFVFVAMELATLAGLVALGLYTAARYGDRLTALVAVLRVLVGIKLLQWIWAGLDHGVDGLPGFAGTEVQRGVFEVIAANHWPVVGQVVTTVVLPLTGLWVVVLGLLQLAVGLALVVGYRTRLAGLVGLVYLGVLILLGMTRYAPFVFGLLVPVVALDGGRVLSIDSLLRPAREVVFGLPVAPKAVPVLTGLAALTTVVAAVVAFRTGVTPNGYVDSMPAMVTTVVALVAGLLAFVGWLQQHPRLDHSGELTVVPVLAGPSEPV
jgi:hypothetical protein